MNVVKEYIDRALSANTDNRPDFQRMIKDISKELFDVVVVCDIMVPQKTDHVARKQLRQSVYFLCFIDPVVELKKTATGFLLPEATGMVEITIKFACDRVNCDKVQ